MPTPVKTAIPAKLDSEEFFTLIISAKMVGHILHLQTDSFAVHKALNKFYDDVTDAADSVIETFQGAVKEIVHYDMEAIADFGLIKASPLEYLGLLRGAIESNRYEIIDKAFTNVHNELDNFITAIDSTVYKLTFLQ